LERSKKQEIKLKITNFARNTRKLARKTPNLSYENQPKRVFLLQEVVKEENA
jgi:hypothetical protein